MGIEEVAMQSRAMKIHFPARYSFLFVLTFSLAALMAAVPLRADEAPTTKGVDRVKGNWLRTEGGYVIQVKSIAADGKAEVVYLNPRPINVESASVRKTDRGIVLKLVLRDVGYPGSSYDVTYDPEDDTLKGSYTQPAAGQTYRIEFVRTH